MQDCYYCSDVELKVQLRQLSHEAAAKCMQDVMYLRTRNRWSQELEDELVELHLQGIQPNMCEFGVTKETQQNLMMSVRDILAIENPELLKAIEEGNQEYFILH